MSTYDLLSPMTRQLINVLDEADLMHLRGVDQTAIETAIRALLAEVQRAVEVGAALTSAHCRDRAMHADRMRDELPAHVEAAVKEKNQVITALVIGMNERDKIAAQAAGGRTDCGTVLDPYIDRLRADNQELTTDLTVARATIDQLRRDIVRASPVEEVADLTARLAAEQEWHAGGRDGHTYCARCNTAALRAPSAPEVTR